MGARKYLIGWVWSGNANREGKIIKKMYKLFQSEIGLFFIEKIWIGCEKGNETI